jgi:hypothetical protein
LPQRSYEYAEWYKARVNFDYHIEVDDHFYSVPFQLLHERLDIRQTAITMEAFRKGERVAAHARSYVKGGYTTLKEHMPPNHRAYAEWNPARFIQWASKTGEATAHLVEQILSARTYPEQSYRSCMGIIQLGRCYGTGACRGGSEKGSQIQYLLLPLDESHPFYRIGPATGHFRTPKPDEPAIASKYPGTRILSITRRKYA